MPYIGKSPTGSGVRTRYYFTATGGETSLSGADDGGKTLTFSDGEYVDVYLNGVALVAGTDYGTATANTIGGLAALSGGDIVEVVVYDIYNVAKINSEAVRTRHYYTATGGETSIGTAQIPGLSFSGGTEIEVSLNGVSLVQGTDYNTTAANTVGGLSALSAGNVVAIVLYEKFQLADTVSKAQGGTFSGGVTMGSTLSLQSANFKMTDLTTNAFYRTGTWTPIVSGDNATDGDATIFSTTPATAYGTYTRIGDLVAVSWTYINGSGTGYTNNGSDASHLRIVGLPFNLKNEADYNPGGVIHDYLATSGWAAGYTPMTSGIYNTKKIIVHYANGAVMELADAVYWNVANSKFAGSLVYETDEA
jgi:hypothetical protein|tara:strand:- start:6631 stop:7719 length:1089 start_codon:yes stop_codon:yes gene_type:complete